jgi:hypothetical protein
MIDRDNKRNYIRRKKYLDESVSQIRTTLEFIGTASREPPDLSELSKLALRYAEGIDAACWSPRPRPTAEVYQQLISAKTAELCRALIAQAIPNFDFGQLSKLAALKLALKLRSEPLPNLDAASFSPKGDLPNVTLGVEEPETLFGIGLDEGLMDVSFSRISQQFVFRDVSRVAMPF